MQMDKMTAKVERLIEAGERALARGREGILAEADDSGYTTSDGGEEENPRRGVTRALDEGGLSPSIPSLPQQ